jgi:hypothetical protein
MNDVMPSISNTRSLNHYQQLPNQQQKQLEHKRGFYRKRYG